MDQAELLALYDQDQRIHVEWPGQRRVTGTRSFLAYAWLDAEHADEVIRQEMAYFTALGHHFEWKLYDHDRPHDLKDRLAAAGFEIEEPEALQAEAPHPNASPSQAVRRIIHPAQIHEILSVQRDVWGEDFTRLAEELADTLTGYPDQISIFAAYADDLPVCSAWIRYTPHSQFAKPVGRFHASSLSKAGVLHSAAGGADAGRRAARSALPDGRCQPDEPPNPRKTWLPGAHLGTRMQLVEVRARRRVAPEPGRSQVFGPGV
jgi:hypothetical protein